MAVDNPDVLCAACQAKARDLALGPPQVPAGFWTTDRMRDALAAWHFGLVIAAYRNHPFHGRPVPQQIVAGWMGITQAQLSRIENGPPVQSLDRLIYWARIFQVPAHLLWFKLPEHRHLPLYAPGPAAGQPAGPNTVPAVSRREARVPNPSRRANRHGRRPDRSRHARRLGTAEIVR